ncbi:uncharacterized protein LOC100843672 isoform X1 [Brachypodium distachyon]|uniref:DUF629 domain-containing protein n=1 Tax=Brachypodium distachyon TaxID=15368 RepID=A0A2K2CZG1_BRADI|nr:uncharacterized protein LOC100843672 isoform X1 [Brachypodium distachyon]XP_024318210.1 uncharacterized protein LOC100843672 isoform X1 [Brachypodium distachyon]XP_024318211.1 uncharacterized protein LOC100843672 isoform X1 [Brachypodium distachyon]XP_024318212.1 uncharacterized protein LOC100843672 isoform X1 [Brachypodium distachyon]XP_024318213.1 uncharacterized protein LOC100843672 isoform X1 [Brachypodium distachyon]XP_024318214.1 uncharacterized protein LOC100843672 isoform X1 [Brachy|eukprot:XP_024318209.1 uncharacterized protein LOC100843672 isoform X1 [Brachypodium distachyon]
MDDRGASVSAAIRDEAREALKLHSAGHPTEALTRAKELASAHPDSAVALNLAGSLHQQAGVMAWTNRSPDEEGLASALEWYHHRASLNAFSAAARLAPECVVTAVAHAQELAACHQFCDAQAELCRARALSTTHTGYADPAVHNVEYDLFRGSTKKARKQNAVAKVHDVIEGFAIMVCNEIIPREAEELLNANKLGGRAAAEARERAKLLSLSYPYSGRAQILRAYIDLAQVRALDLAIDKMRFLRRTLSMIGEAAKVFRSSLMIALFHAKLLFVLDEFDAAEEECRRALRIETPCDPNEDDIPPLAVRGADYDARVSSVKKQLRVLLKHIVVVAALYWSHMVSTLQEERIISFRVDTLHEHYGGIDQSAAKTIADARRFIKKHNSWSFWICPHSRCDGKKFMDTDSLWQHMCSKHREELWKKLQSILGPELCENTSEGDHSLDGITVTLCQDSGQHDIFHLPRVQDMFESLLHCPSIGIQTEPFAEMRQRKCREGCEILEGIKEKLRMLPSDVFSTEFVEYSFGIQNLWLKFLEISVMDYREVILPLARSFQWTKIKRWIAYNVNDPDRSIGDVNIDTVFSKVHGAPDRSASIENGSNPSHSNSIDHQNGENLKTENGDVNIDTVFGKVPGAPDRSVSVENGSNPSHSNNIYHQNGENLKTENGDVNIDNVFGKVPGASDRSVSLENGSNPSHSNNIDHQNGENLKTENLKPLCSDETLKADEKYEERYKIQVCAEDGNSGTVVNQRTSDPPIDVHENGMDILSRIAVAELDKRGTSGQAVNEMTSTSNYEHIVIVLNKNNAGEDQFILNLIIQLLCNLRHFRDKFLTEPLVWIPCVDNPCIAQIFYEIFSSWEKNEHHLTDVLLTYMETLLCGIVDCNTFYEKLQVGKNLASEIVATILIGLHMSETSSRFRFNRETERQVVNPITCGDCICPTHNLFGIKFDAQMSCRCGNCSEGYLYTTLFHKLDAGSPQTTKIKSFAELPVLLDEQFCRENDCAHCGSLQNIDLFLSNTPHFFTIVLNWLGGSESQDTFSEVLAGISSPHGTEFFCRSAHSATMYAVTSMVIQKGGESNELCGIG